ncbi:MAG: c-type cytochrome [Acetobacteraceae bacterium]|nr:c-type cytochrome [Acetobacteraceae bacterium]
MTTLLFGAEWVNLAQCVLLTGAFFLLLLAGQPATDVMRGWEHRVLSWARWVVVVALASGVAVLATQTALFEGRPEAALEPRAILHAMLDTRPGFVWMLRHGLLIVLAAFLFLGGDVTARRDWIAARGEAFALAALALVLLGSSGHLAASSESPWPQAIDMAHRLGAGIWVGGLPPLALLLYGASKHGVAPDPCAVRTMRRFSPVALVTVLSLVGSDVASAWLLVGGVAGLVGTTHGRLLLAKLAVLVPALLLAAASRAALPTLSSAASARPSATAQRMAWFIATEAVLVFVLLGFATAMTETTPALHDDPVWPWPVRLSLDALPRLAQPPIAFALVGFGLAILAILFLARRRPVLLFGTVFVVVAGGAAIFLPPLMVEAYPTSFTRPPVPYAAGSIAAGMAVYQARCASCHGTPTAGRTVDLLAPRTRRRSAGDLFWLITHGRPERGMPAFGSLLGDAERWHVINFLRALGTATDQRRVGAVVEPNHAWLAAPDLTISVGPLTPRTLSDYRGKRMVLLVLYALPGSRARMTELARQYGTLSVLGVEVVAVPPRSAPEAIAELGQSPPVLFPVVTDGNEDIAAAYRLFAPGGAHAELLIDRQGYIRAIWGGDQTGMPEADAVQAQVERLNEEKSPPLLPEDHVH